MLWQALRTPQGMGSVALPQSPLQSPAPAPVTPPPAPASPQGVDQATMQRMFDDFRRQYENERRDSDMQAQAMIRQEMQRLAAKMDDLSNQARAEAEARQMPAGGKQFGKPRLSPLAPAKGAHVDLSDEAPSGGGRRGKRESGSSNGIGTRMRQSPMRTPPVRQTPPQREPVDLPLTMRPLVYTYLVRYEFSHGLEYVALARGALAGMAESVYLQDGHTDEAAATVLYDCTLQSYGAEAQVQTFGVPNYPGEGYGRATQVYTLNLEVRLNNGKILDYEFDVTAQVEKQPRGGVILVDGIEVSDEDGQEGSGGFDVDVDGWGDYVDIPLPLE